jgi:hypothetical protein
VSRRVSIAAPALALALLLSSCAGCGPYQNVGMESVPPGAEVYLDGYLIGTTPMKTSVWRHEDHSVFLKKPGYRPELVVLRRNDPPDGLFFLTPADVRVRLSRQAGADGEPDAATEEGAEEGEGERTSTRDVQVEVEKK